MKKNVLLVEDDPALRMVMKEVLRDDFEVGEADNGLDGIKLANDRSVDLMILDYHLPKRDGLEVIREVKQHRPELQVIVLTGFLNDYAEKRFRELGAAEIFPKPFNYRTLLEKVRGLVLPSAAHSAAPGPLHPAAAIFNLTATPGCGETEVLGRCFTSLQSIAEKLEYLHHLTEKYWLKPNDVVAIRHAVRLMNADLKRFYGGLNRDLYPLGNFTQAAADKSAELPYGQGEN
ncbi:MAG: response regulator [Puniceicoccaceae bacterium]|nr:MAG: response regulator [Puniceicoccaceae bacterium]